MKGAAAVDPVRRSKHWTERPKGAKEARSEPQPVDRGGGFQGVIGSGCCSRERGENNEDDHNS